MVTSGSLPVQRRSFAIIMAKGEDGAATMFLTDMDQPGIEIVRTMDSLDQAFAGGHAVVRFKICVCRRVTFSVNQARDSATRR